MSKHDRNKAGREGTTSLEFRTQRGNAVSPVKELRSERTAAATPPSFKVTPIRKQATDISSSRAYTERIIRERAYELYEERGRQDGHAEEDWLRAEAEVLGAVFRGAKGAKA